MNTFWIGDFRLAPLRRLYNSSSSLYENYSYITEDNATCSWLSNRGINSLAKYITSEANIVIMLGFMDCINSCIFGTDIKKAAQTLVSDVKKLAVDYKHNKNTFYLCTIPPVDGSYPSSFAKGGKVSADILNNKIKTFNNELLKANDIDNLVDSHAYFTKTSFATIDGIRFDEKTLGFLHDFIAEAFVSTVGKPFEPRTVSPGSRDPYHRNFWTSVNKGGLNTYPIIDKEGDSGDTLPNCTAYAWGRFYEIIGSVPAAGEPSLLKHNNAEEWFLANGKHNYGNDGYRRGDTPELGAVICWSKGNPDGTSGGNDDGAGHVAIVEAIYDDGSILTSESGYKSEAYWWTTRRKKGSNGNWGQGLAYTFQGFIYNPAVTPTPDAIAVTKDEVTTHKGVTTTKERETNALYIYKYLGGRGWTLNAVAALLGNMEHESWINPGVTEIGGTGFGLVQWTPPSKFTKWCDSQIPPLPHDDVDSQLARIEHERDSESSPCTITGGCGHSQYTYRTKDSYGDKYAITFMPKTFKEFATSTLPPADLASAFLYNYECPGSICWGAGSYSAGKSKTIAEREVRRAETRKVRGAAAEKWYKFLAPYSLDTFKTFSLTGLKVDKVTTTRVSASFIVKGGSSGYYSIFDSAGKLVEKIDLSSKIIASANTATLISFSSTQNKLKPNEEYHLNISVNSSEKDKVATQDIIFSTLQDYPESVSKVTLIQKDSDLLTGTLQLITDTSDLNWSYWASANDDHGYTIQLIINGIVVKQKEVTSVPKTLKINDYFKTSINIGDTVQIGIRTWVMYEGAKLYDGEFAKTSNPVCASIDSIKAYLAKNK